MASQDTQDLAAVDKEWEDFVNSNPPIPKIRGTIAQMREVLSSRKKAMTAAAGPPPSNVKQEDRTVAARDGYKIPTRIYTPATSPASGSPLVVLYHGGGFCLGDLSGEEMNARNFASELGAVCVNVDYRRAPEHTFPIPVEDSWDVLAWAAKNATSLGADPSKGFIILGTSAGGNLAVVLSHMARDTALSPPLTGVALLIPVVMDHTGIPAKYKDLHTSYAQNADAAILDAKLMQFFLEEYKYDTSSHLYNVFAEPESSFADLPPTFLQVCGGDPLRDDALVYEHVLRENGGKTRLEMYEGLPHSFWSFAPTLGVSKRFVGDTVEGVRWLLNQ